MEKIRIVLDGYGGDNAPQAVVSGAIRALERNDDIHIIITGDEGQLKDILRQKGCESDDISIVHTSQVIEMSEHPVSAIRNKRDSSMSVGLKLVSSGDAEAFVSAGNSGALLVGGQTIVGRIRGVKSAPFAAVIPTAQGRTLLVDSGSRVDVGPETIVQYAYLGQAYMSSMFDIKDPSVSILNIGAEEEKGNKLVQDTFPLLKEKDDINFIGSFEARNILAGGADIVLADGFSGNILLKTIEGTSQTLLSEIKKGFMSSTKTKIGALLIKSAIKDILSTYDSKKYGGAPLLGVKGIVLKTHGNAKEEEIANTVIQAAELHKAGFIEKLTQTLDRQ